MAVINAMFLKLTTLLTITALACGLYEDQIGKFDWKKSHIGKLKFAYFDSVKRIVVATEENVLASLNLKNGQIAWRHLLEDAEGFTVDALKVDTEAITISGNGNVYYIRGWDLNTGTMIYEWSMSTEKTGSKWAITDTQVVHLVPTLDGPSSNIEVTLYNLKTGVNKGTTSKVSTPWIQNDCVLAGNYYTCLVNGELYSIDLTGNLMKVHKESLSSIIGDVAGKLDIHPIETSVHPAVLIRRNNINRFVYIGEKLKSLPYSLEHNVISVSNNDDYSLMHFDFSDSNQLQIKNIDLANGETKSHPLDLSADFPNSALIAGICRSANCRILLKGVDDSISLLQLPAGKIQWTREEALGDVLAAEFVELPLSESDVSIEREFNENSNGVVSMFTRRILSQLKQLGLLLSPGQKASEENGLVRDMFGLHKLIILATKVGKIFAIDTISGEVVWMKHIPQMTTFNVLSKSKVLLYQQRTARHAPFPAVMILVGKHAESGKGLIYMFDPICGKTLSEIKLNYKIKQSMLMPYEDKEHIKGLVLLSEDNQLHVYPEHARNVLNEYSSTMFMYNADVEESVLTGYTLYFSQNESPKATPTWRVNFADSKIVSINTRPEIERVHSQGRVLADRSVFYKYINPNLIAVATVADDVLHKHVLSVYLIDGVSGLIVHSAHHKRANGPIHMVHSENWLVYSYFSERFRRNEITAVELYEGARQSNSTAFSSHALSQLPHPETLSYILPMTPLAMMPTLTERGITNKHVLIALSRGSVIELPWAYLEPRGPHLPSNPEEGYVPYMPELPIYTESIINYNQSLAKIKGIQVSPARLESTSLVIVYGLDLFYTRVTPSKTFDVLKEDFDHWLIIMVLVGLTLASYGSKRLSIRKALKQVWK